MRSYQAFGAAVACTSLFGLGAAVAAWADGPHITAGGQLITMTRRVTIPGAARTQTTLVTRLRRVRVTHHVTLQGGTRIVTQSVLEPTRTVTQTRVFRIPTTIIKPIPTTVVVTGPTTTITTTVTVPTT